MRLRVSLIGIFAALLSVEGCGKSLASSAGSSQSTTQRRSARSNRGNDKLKFLMKEAARKSSRGFQEDLDNGVYKIIDRHKANKGSSDPQQVKKELDQETERLVRKHGRAADEIREVVAMIREAVDDDSKTYSYYGGNKSGQVNSNAIDLPN